MGYYFIDLDGGPDTVFALARKIKEFFVLKWNPYSSGWKKIAAFPIKDFGEPLRIACTEVSEYTEIWTISGDGKICKFRLEKNQMQNSPPTPDWKIPSHPPGRALDIACAGDGTVYAVWDEKRIGWWNPNRNKWTTYSLSQQIINIDAQFRSDTRQVQAIAVLQDGKSGVFQPEPNPGSYRWIALNGSSNDIGIQSTTHLSRQVWCTGFNIKQTNWGAYIYLLDSASSNQWKWAFPGAAVRITVDKEGNPWVINTEGKIFSGSNLGPISSK